MKWKDEWISEYDTQRPHGCQASSMQLSLTKKDESGPFIEHTTSPMLDLVVWHKKLIFVFCLSGGRVSKSDFRDNCVQSMASHVNLMLSTNDTARLS